MPEIVLHFDGGADAKTLAKALQERAAALPGVESAEVESFPARTGVEEVILTMMIAGSVLQGGASLLDALKHFIESCRGVAVALGLGSPRVEVGMEQVAPEALTQAHVKELEAGQ